MVGQAHLQNKERRRFLVIIPAYNEEEHIAEVIDKIRKTNSNYDILVINDCSTDLTVSIASRSGAGVISHAFNIGYGGTIQTGYKFALEQGYDYIAQIDGDGQHDPSYLNRLFDSVQKGEADIVLGSRFLGENTFRMPFIRKVGQWLFGWIATLIIDQKITDPTTGYQSFTKEVAEFMAQNTFPQEYPDADLIIMLHYAGFKIKEIPVRMYPKVDGKSMHSGLFKPFRYVVEMTLSILLIILRGKVYAEKSNN